MRATKKTPHSMALLQEINALEILDSRGNPTLQVTVTTDSGASGTACVPSGASTGEHEACELRDGDKSRYKGKGVKKAALHASSTIADLLREKSIFAQSEIDYLMINSDGTTRKKRLGANAILGVSLAVAKAAAAEKNVQLYKYLNRSSTYRLPMPMMNIINGGVHGNNGLDFQEFMIVPVSAKSLAEAVRMGSEIFHTLKLLLEEKGEITSVGDEGGFAPKLQSHEAALDFIISAIEKSGFTAGKDVTLALDCAASEFYDRAAGLYLISGKSYTSDQLIDYLEKLSQKYPITSIEDGLDQNDWAGWKKLTKRLGARIQLVGDDLFVTNKIFLQRGINEKIANAILIKPNQIGSLTETLETIELAQKNGYACILSHRSGETEDTTIADIAVATSCGQIKTGSLSRSERVAKYNRLITIEDHLGKNALFQ